MPLITRISRLFQADLHAVLDRIEEPAALLRQAVREMEEDLARDEQRMKVLNHDLGQLMAQQADLDRSLARIDGELAVCFESARDDLARPLIRRKLETERMVTLVSGKRETLEQTLAGLKVRLEENRARLEGMRQKAELLAEEDLSRPPEDPLWRTPEGPIRDEEVEVALLREKQKRGRS